MTIPGRSPAAGTTFPGLLATLLRTDPTRPLVTFYDDATAERIELSVTTYANWVAKTAALAQDELDLERGGLLLVDLPTHWLGAVWLGAAWTLGLRVTDDPQPADPVDLVVCGPEGLASYAGGPAPVLAASLRPLGGRFVDPLPAGVTDYGAVVLGQPDTFVADDPAIPTDVAWQDAAGTSTQGQLLAAVAAEPVVAAGGRLLTDLNPCTRTGLATLLAPVLLGGSAVWVRHPDESAWAARADQERATAQLRA